ncbi:MAG: helix-turn-helix transcriptional regulator [Phycisphaeraceae bacterium]|nr:helix-turn-helix transcriptional regulator [Phycisphaerales bacterium]MCB9842331.1 helix-turn-helix transcriptional regulator [Phycisphaeraceae bacterium]
MVKTNGTYSRDLGTTRDRAPADAPEPQPGPFRGEIARRVRDLTREISNRGLARILGVSRETARRYRYGRTPIPAEVIAHLCLEFHADPDWIITRHTVTEAAACGDERARAHDRTRGNGRQGQRVARRTVIVQRKGGAGTAASVAQAADSGGFLYAV